MSDDGGSAAVLRNKRDATRYRILVEIAQRQPAVSQREIADEIGVTAQAVSEHLGDLVEEGYVDREARGRYEVTKEGVDWLISETDALDEYVSHVSEEVIGDVEVDAALAAAPVAEGDRVRLSMEDGVLTARPLGGSESDDDGGDESGGERGGGANDTDGGSEGDDGDETDGATAVALTDAAAGSDVGVTEFQGVLDYELGTVTGVEVPSVRAGGSSVVDTERVAALAADADVIATAGTEALAAARAAGLDPDVRFGTVAAVEEAATKGLDVLLLAESRELSSHADRLRDSAVAYEVASAA
ncbi:MarR family transcriptional regulator [Halobaculum sp. MBLA0147]|uniref:DUF7839 domain-containing protein n=1 Tax=Halobaculum sp. MBLA0147 TaxID=3079934 RepID=UPI003524BB30